MSYNAKALFHIVLAHELLHCILQVKTAVFHNSFFSSKIFLSFANVEVSLVVKGCVPLHIDSARIGDCRNRQMQMLQKFLWLAASGSITMLFRFRSQSQLLKFCPVILNCLTVSFRNCSHARKFKFSLLVCGSLVTWFSAYKYVQTLARSKIR